MNDIDNARALLERHGQGHLLAFWGRLDDAQRQTLLQQLGQINWDELGKTIQSYVLRKPEAHIPDDLDAASFFPLVPDSPARRALYERATARGEEMLRSGRVAAFTVAGGQGTRLGFDGPKGTFPITPVKHKPLFQYFAESIVRLSQKHGHPLPWYIMTSELNDQATRGFFAANGNFGLGKDDVVFFSQGTMPAIGLDGKLLLASPGSLALAPDGHGGSLTALRRSGALDDMRSRGVDTISYFQVDNPLVGVADPLFLGLHDLERSEMSAIMLPKTGPYEKLGNFCVSQGKLQIIEYSDMPAKLAEARKPDGQLKFLAGSPAIHVLSRAFAERLTAGGSLRLPWHRADKKVPCVDAAGAPVNPAEPNAVKVESFIFDALPLADKTMILEAAREDKFAPTKNKEGVDSVVSCRAMLVDRDSRWLNACGVNVPPGCVVELSPKSFVDAEDVAARAAAKPFPPLTANQEYYFE